MSGIISKELLSEVLGENIDTIVLINNKLHIGNSVMVGEINIHELAHKCKEWASKQGRYFIFTRTNLETNNLHIGAIAYISDEFYINGAWKSKEWDSFKAKSEPEAIFKATQYIYDNLSNL